MKWHAIWGQNPTIVGSYGDTLPDKEVLRQLRQWNDRKATEVTGRSKLQSKMKEFVDRAHQRALKQNEKAGKLMPKRRKTAPEKPA